MTKSELEFRIGEARSEVDKAEYHRMGETDPVGMDQLISKLGYLRQQLDDGAYEEDPEDV